MEKPQNYPELAMVVTMQEAAKMAYVNPSTIRLAIDRGRVAAVECGRIVLVSVRSLCRAYPHVSKPG